MFYINFNAFIFSQVLWMSNDGIPDIGGINEEDTCFADEVSFI